MKQPKKLTRVQKQLLSKISERPIRISEINDDHQNLVSHGLVEIKIRPGQGQFLQCCKHND